MDERICQDLCECTRKCPAQVELSLFSFATLFETVAKCPHRQGAVRWNVLLARLLVVLQVQVMDTVEETHLNWYHEKHFPGARLAVKCHLSCLRGVKGRIPFSRFWRQWKPQDKLLIITCQCSTWIIAGKGLCLGFLFWNQMDEAVAGLSFPGVSLHLLPGILGRIRMKHFFWPFLEGFMSIYSALFDVLSPSCRRDEIYIILALTSLKHPLSFTYPLHHSWVPMKEPSPVLDSGDAKEDLRLFLNLGNSLFWMGGGERAQTWKKI